jgi:hypothetical protein
MKFTQSVLGITCVLALALGASPASAQSRERGGQRHGSDRQAQSSRQGPSREARVQSGRGPDRGADRGISRAAVRTSRGPSDFRGGSGDARGYNRGSYVRSYSPSRSYGSPGRSYNSYNSRSYGSYGAVPRVYAQRRHGGTYRGSGRVYRDSGRVYRGSGRYYRPYYRPYYRSYYYPSRFYFGYNWYPYAFGGYSYLYPGFYGYGYGWGNPYGPYGYGGYYNNNGYAEDQGGIRLQMNPKDAQVTVDGYFVGVVDDFDGISQRLELEEGPHRIEITAPGFEPFSLEVNILRAQTIKYKGLLRPLP